MVLAIERCPRQRRTLLTWRVLDQRVEVPCFGQGRPQFPPGVSGPVRAWRPVRLRPRNPSKNDLLTFGRSRLRTGTTDRGSGLRSRAARSRSRSGLFTTSSTRTVSEVPRSLSRLIAAKAGAMPVRSWARSNARTSAKDIVDTRCKKPYHTLSKFQGGFPKSGSIGAVSKGPYRTDSSEDAFHM